MIKQVLVHPYKETLLGNKKKNQLLTYATTLMNPIEMTELLVVENS